MKNVKTVKKKCISALAPTEDNVKEALYKKAVGFEVSEVTEEYSYVEDKLELIKKKINTKFYPPDLSAIELALDSMGENRNEYSKYSDEELFKERDVLLELYKKYKGESCRENNEE